METPYTTHLTADDFRHVYEPAEDSFLLLDALEADLPALRAAAPTLCIEIGPGSGVIVSALARTLGSTALCVAVDINAQACRCTAATARRHGAHVELLRGDLLGAVRPRSADVLVFNPPYVVTPDAEVSPQMATPLANANAATNALIAHAWAGGAAGRRVTDRFLGRLDEWLSVRGCAYLVLIRENDPPAIVRDLGDRGFVGRVIKERKVPGEHLFVMKIERREACE